MSVLKRTALFDFHVAKKAKIVPFAGWEMPVQYPEGILKEHLQTRTKAGLFDVSHMCQTRFRGADREKFLEYVTVGDFKALKPTFGRLSLLMLPTGTIKDDTIISKYEDHFLCVLNAGCAPTDLVYIRECLAGFKGDVQLEIIDRSLLALQGPAAHEVLGRYVEGLDKLSFLQGRTACVKGFDVHLTRCGYTGEDGFEISVAHKDAISLAELFCSNAEVKPIGLGARDTLRLEAGMCLYGHELSDKIDPIAADLQWTITKRRMAEGGFIGHASVAKKAADAAALVPEVRVGIMCDVGPCPREQSTVHCPETSQQIGVITSGSPSPTLGRNIAQAYVQRKFKAPGSKVAVHFRGKVVQGEVVKLPFIPGKYYRAKA